MAQTIQDVMTKNPVTLSGDSTATEAARKMREADIGPVLVVDDDNIHGIVTDRDIVVRVLAEGRDVATTSLDEVCSHEVVAVGTGTGLDAAAETMRANGVRRLPVVENGRPVGFVSLGDLAIERDPDSALADISAAEPNN